MVDGPSISTTTTYSARIYVGLRPGYHGPEFQAQDAIDIVRRYVDTVGLCVTVTPTTFVYRGGTESGAIVGLINYPRFPVEPARIREHAMTLGRLLRAGLGQLRVSVEFPEETVMLGEAADDPNPG